MWSISFNDEMVRAILEGRKTQTRRLPKRGILPPYINGETVWVRETFIRENPLCDKKITYRADYPAEILGKGWSPSIHMPQWASRITLVILNVRMERLQEITPEDVRSEGVIEEAGDGLELRDKFANIWDSIYEKKLPWSSNPWVWVIEFRRINNNAF